MSTKPPSDDEKAKEIKQHLEEALRRIQNTPHRQNQNFSGKGAAKSTGQAPPKGRPFRHQGR